MDIGWLVECSCITTPWAICCRRIFSQIQQASSKKSTPWDAHTVWQMGRQGRRVWLHRQPSGDAQQVWGSSCWVSAVGGLQATNVPTLGDTRSGRGSCPHTCAGHAGMPLQQHLSVRAPGGCIGQSKSEQGCSSCPQARAFHAIDPAADQLFGETRAAAAAGICFSYPLAVQSIQSSPPSSSSGRHNQVQTAAAPIPTFMFMPHCHGGEPCSCLCSSLTGQSRSCGVSVYACGYEVSITPAAAVSL